MNEGSKHAARSPRKAIGIITPAIALACGLLIGIAGPAHASNTDSSISGIVVAEDARRLLTAKPSAPGVITVSTAPRTRVSVFPQQSQRTKVTGIREEITNGKGIATFADLTIGIPHTVLTTDASVTVVPIAGPGAVTGLRVTTSDAPTSVQLVWAHRTAKGLSPVHFLVEAVDLDGTTITDEVDGTTASLTGLDPRVRYTFRVTPINPLGAGKPSSARMNRTLEEITGRVTPMQIGPTENPTPVPTPAKPSQSSQAAPQAGAPSAPAPAGPRTRMIYVCPDGFSEDGNACTQTTPYTFRTETRTQPYTYHSESRLEACSGPDCPGSVYRDFGTDWTGGSCPNGGTFYSGQCLGWTGSTRTVSIQVKDAPPAGWQDNGSAYTQQAQVKDTPPPGFSDNGSAWVKTTSRVATEVPA